MSEPVHVEVEVPATEPETPSEVTPAVTVVETGTESDNGITATVIDHEGRIAQLVAENEELRARLDAAEATAAVAQATADVAIEATDEAVAEVAEIVAESEPQPVADDDIEPHREHWFFR